MPTPASQPVSQPGKSTVQAMGVSTIGNIERFGTKLHVYAKLCVNLTHIACKYVTVNQYKIHTRWVGVHGNAQLGVAGKVSAFEAAAHIGAGNAGLEALAILFKAPGFLAVAPCVSYNKQRGDQVK